jgi:hypothetical protein
MPERPCATDIRSEPKIEGAKTARVTSYASLADMAQYDSRSGRFYEAGTYHCARSHARGLVSC